jgi:propionyl-CoA carboxylase alpha chain
VGSAALTEAVRFPVPVVDRPAGSMVAPMPGTVGRVAVTVGQTVEAGALLLTLEAMKLEHAIHAPEPGIVAELHVQTGSQVEAGAVLALLTPDAPPSPDVPSSPEAPPSPAGSPSHDQPAHKPHRPSGSPS